MPFLIMIKWIIEHLFCFRQEEMIMSKKVVVFVGTQKGGFIFESNEKRKRWKVSDVQLKGWTVMQIKMYPRNQPLPAAPRNLVHAPPPTIQMMLDKPGRRQSR